MIGEERTVDVLYRQLTAALALADELDLAMVGIHIDEARSLLAGERAVDGPDVETTAA